MERIEALVEQGIDVVCVDSAHGHSKNVLDTLTAVKKRWPYQFDLIGGNVATGAGAQAIIDCGVDAIKVGVGPGSICTTRVVTGIGVPQVTALMETVAVPQQSAYQLFLTGVFAIQVISAKRSAQVRTA